jgi:hypothetical protein
MDDVLTNLLSPAVLFFGIGLLAVSMRSDLDLPSPLPKVLSLFLLLAIGFKGGFGLRASELGGAQLLTLGAAVLMACVTPVASYYLLRKRIGSADAAAIAACYGSISAVTFITAAAFLEKLGVGYGGHMVAAMALMESPAIVIGVLLYRIHGAKAGESIDWGYLLREAFFNGPVFILVGAMLVGLVANTEASGKLMEPIDMAFRLALVLFLLDMGIVAGRQLQALRRTGAILGVYSVLVPVGQGLVGLGFGRMVGASAGDALLLAILCGSASYIAVPAAIRLAIPQANPSLYVPMALALTFPFNVVVGIPLYWFLIGKMW